MHSETTEGDSALYLATFAVLNLNRDNLDVLKVLINAGKILVFFGKNISANIYHVIYIIFNSYCSFVHVF